MGEVGKGLVMFCDLGDGGYVLLVILGVAS